jgi:hypothetical protein
MQAREESGPSLGIAYQQREDGADALREPLPLPSRVSQ